jgi:hypothetical protein
VEEIINFQNSATTLLCLVVRKAWMCCCLQVSNTCNHVSCSWELHMEHVMEGYKLGPKNNCF